MIKVELCHATLPGPLGWVAVHCWFVVWDHRGGHRWEVWQAKNAGGRSAGHVHCDLKPAHAGVGGGPARVVMEWHGREAHAIAAVLERLDYPLRERYVAWPGPNSNTFVAWVLRQAGIVHRLPRSALGARYRVLRQRG